MSRWRHFPGGSGCRIPLRDRRRQESNARQSEQRDADGWRAGGFLATRIDCLYVMLRQVHHCHTHTPTHRHTQHTPDTRKSILNFSTSRALPVGPPPPPGRCLVHSQSRNCQPMPRGGMAGCSIGRRSVRIEKRRIEKSRGVGQTWLFVTGTSEGEEVARLLSCCWPVSLALVGPDDTPIRTNKKLILGIGKVVAAS